MLKHLLSIDLEGARKLLELIEKHAIAQRAQVSIVIVDTSGNFVLGVRMDDAGPATFEAAMKKARTAVRFGKDTLEYYMTFESVQFIGRDTVRTDPALGARDDANRRNCFSDFVSWGGGVTVHYDGKIVGAVGVSGLTQEEDHKLASLASNGLMDLV